MSFAFDELGNCAETLLGDDNAILFEIDGHGAKVDASVHWEVRSAVRFLAVDFLQHKLELLWTFLEVDRSCVLCMFRRL